MRQLFLGAAISLLLISPARGGLADSNDLLLAKVQSVQDLYRARAPECYEDYLREGIAVIYGACIGRILNEGARRYGLPAPRYPDMEQTLGLIGLKADDGEYNHSRAMGEISVKIEQHLRDQIQAFGRTSQ